MPTFVKCGNPECPGYGQFQALESPNCGDCGLPFDKSKSPKFIIVFNGPLPREIHIQEAANVDEAITLGLKQLSDEGLNPNAYRVTHTYGPDRIPNFNA